MMTHADCDLDKLGPVKAPPDTFKIYRGVRNGFGGPRTVTVNGVALKSVLEVWHFDWGGSTRNSVQLALAILADHGGQAFANNFFTAFNFYVLRDFKTDRWQLTSDEINKFVREFRLGKIK